MISIRLARRLWPLPLVALVAAIALALSWPGTSPGIIIVDGKPAALGAVDLKQGQTLHVSIACVVGFDPQPDPPICRLQAGVVDAANNAIGNPGIFDLRPGVSRSFDYVALGDGVVRPVVVDLAPNDDCPAVVSVGIVDRGALNGIIVVGGVPVNPMVFSKS
jgi:hypothetical protein